MGIEVKVDAAAVATTEAVSDELPPTGPVEPMLPPTALMDCHEPEVSVYSYDVPVE